MNLNSQLKASPTSLLSQELHDLTIELQECKAKITEQKKQATIIHNLEESTKLLKQQFKDLQKSITLQFFEETTPSPHFIKIKKVTKPEGAKSTRADNLDLTLAVPNFKETRLLAHFSNSGREHIGLII